MPQLHWQALRRPLRACAIAGLIWLAFLSFWQLAVPGDEQGAGGLAVWAFIVAASVLLSCGLVLPVSAGGHLWGAGRRRTAFAPAACLLLGLFGLPLLVRAAGGSPSLGLACLVLVLLAAAAGSGYVIVSVAEVPMAGPHGALEFNPDDPSGYARDVPAKREPR